MAKAMKKVYVVRGSEDGTIAVKSNFKAAYNEAVNYMKDHMDTIPSYRSCLKYMKDHGWCQVGEYYKHHCEAEINWFYLESN